VDLSSLAYRFETLHCWVGHELGVSDWTLIDQQKIEAFAECTGDRQWMHLDAVRCLTKSPFGEPVAHGFLSMGILARALAELGGVPPDASGAINVAVNNVRFRAPVRAGMRVRGRARIADVVVVSEKQKLVTTSCELSAEDECGPLVTAEMIVLVFR
jgi:acyl dehydratase